jgi:hypothetical protein
VNCDSLLCSCVCLKIPSGDDPLNRLLMLHFYSSSFVEFIHFLYICAKLWFMDIYCAVILRCNYILQVRNLQRQLQEEIDMHLALTDAIAHNAELILKSSTKLPNKVCTHQCTYICNLLHVIVDGHH